MRVMVLKPLAAASVMALILGSCGPLPRGATRSGGSAGGEAAFTSACRGDFGATAAANHFEAFMEATYAFHSAANETQETLLDACRAMGRELEMPAASLAGSGPEATRTVCDAVGQQLRTEMAAVRAASETTVELRTRPPRCEATFDAFASCAAECQVEVTPGELEMNCSGGEIRGGCSGECTGRCAVEVTAECQGICEGICEGQCSVQGPDGSCAGTCDGTCNGQCVVDATAECGGQCRGSCSVTWERPYCTGHYEPPQIDAECRAACEARLDATLECEPAQAELSVSGGPDEATLARAARVREAVRVGWATILTVRERVQRLQASGRTVLRELENIPEAIRTVGLSAAACSAGAVADLQQSLASVSVSVEVSVSVSASFESRSGG